MPWSQYTELSRGEWARLRADTPLTLSVDDLRRVQGLNDRVSMAEVTDVYLPLSRLLNLYVAAEDVLYRARATFLGDGTAKVPYVIGLAGSVAVGKSTTARLLRELVGHWPERPKVALVTTDGFLYPRRLLEERALMSRKGFPESYDLPRLIGFLADLKAGRSPVSCPAYSHLTYDIVPGEDIVIDRPDIVILEGLNVLQAGPRPRRGPRAFVSDYFDFSIYLDAPEAEIRRWYIERFLLLRTAAFAEPASYFHRYAALTDSAAEEVAGQIWDEINGPNLRDNILPTRERAHLILEQGADHAVCTIRLRKL
ncbi:MAG TPA: type I pantothenate kinase [Candidatus Methylomirabilis sp.]|nr:type I pantothenate kinase [Candidatus Methylomirabilis sp.]